MEIDLGQDWVSEVRGQRSNCSCLIHLQPENSVHLFEKSFKRDDFNDPFVNLFEIEVSQISLLFICCLLAHHELQQDAYCRRRRHYHVQHSEKQLKIPYSLSNALARVTIS